MPRKYDKDGKMYVWSDDGFSYSILVKLADDEIKQELTKEIVK